MQKTTTLAKDATPKQPPMPKYDNSTELNAARKYKDNTNKNENTATIKYLILPDISPEAFLIPRILSAMRVDYFDWSALPYVYYLGWGLFPQQRWHARDITTACSQTAVWVFEYYPPQVLPQIIRVDMRCVIKTSYKCRSTVAPKCCSQLPRLQLPPPYL